MELVNIVMRGSGPIEYSGKYRITSVAYVVKRWEKSAVNYSKQLSTV